MIQTELGYKRSRQLKTQTTGYSDLRMMNDHPLVKSCSHTDLPDWHFKTIQHLPTVTIIGRTESKSKGYIQKNNVNGSHCVVSFHSSFNEI